MDVMNDPGPDETAPTIGPVIVSASLNAASYNRRGAATYEDRIDRYIDRRMTTEVDVVDLQEVGNGSGRWGRPNCNMRDHLEASWGHRYRRHIGSAGRYCFSNRRRIKPIKSGVITADPSTWFRGDDKQAAYLVFRKEGILGMDVSFHLESSEHQAAEAKRIAQMLSIVSGAVEIASEWDVDVRNLLFVGDANSTQAVPDALAGHGWRNVARGTTFLGEPTFKDWDGRAAKRLDYGFVHDTAGPAALREVIYDRAVSDHAELVIERTLVV